MATSDQISEVRLHTGTIDDPEYTDEYLEQLIDLHGVDGSSARVWQIKAAKFAALVDVTEGSSSRQMSQLHEQAMKMTNHFFGRSGDKTSKARVDRIVRT